MTFLIAQIFVCLLVCAVLGALAGWLARDLTAAGRRRRQEEIARRELRQSDARAGTLKTQLAEARQHADNLRTELARAQAAPPAAAADPEALATLRSELAQRDKKIELLNLQVSQSQAAVSSEWKSIKALKTELAERHSRLEVRGKRLGSQWSKKLKQSEKLRLQQQQQLTALQHQNALLGEDLAATKQTLSIQRERSARRLAELESLRRGLAGEPRPSGDETPDRDTVAFDIPTDDAIVAVETDALDLPAGDSTVAVEVDALDIHDVATDGESPAIEPPTKDPGAEQPPEPDNLEELRGIGPVLKRKLNELGITTFRQIADWTEDDIERISSRLGAFRGRIVRDRWVEKAAERVSRERSAQTSS